MMPDIEARRAAMKKLAFLAGKWASEASGSEALAKPRSYPKSNKRNSDSTA